MRRQNIRQATILVSLLLFPITIYYFSPVLVLFAAAQGVVNGSLVVFGLQFLASLVLGRAFCGWLCPAAGLQEACFRMNSRRTGRHRWVKYLIWVPWVSGIAAALWSAGGPRSIQPLYQIPGGISVAEPSAYIVYYGFVGLIVLLALTAGKRAFCHHVCWMAPFMITGARLKNALHWPALRLVCDTAKCAQCGRCAKGCPMSLDVQRMVQRGRMTDLDCILCGECVDGCPRGAIRYSFSAQEKFRTSPASSKPMLEPMRETE